VYPALAVLQELDDEANELLWVGSKGGMEEDLVSRAGHTIKSLPAAGLHAVSLSSLPANLVQLWRGFWAARQMIRDFQPDVLFFTGGFVAVPIALAGRRIPSLAFVPDIKPGLALRLLSRFAEIIAVVADESKKYVKGLEKMQITGYPLRKELANWKPAEARVHFDLQKDEPTLLVFGGSKGARSINRALSIVLPQLLEDVQIVHVSGELDWDEVKASVAALPKVLRSRYRAFPYLHDDMGAALAAADLVLSRAGASTLGEFPLFELPAILVPLPQEKNLVQHLNADFLAKRGAAVILKDEDMRHHLLDTVQGLLLSDERREAMSTAMAKLAQPHAAKRLARMLMEMGTANKKDTQSA
jgi:UDP-N-acetylglucosamine--N-acetylmuramyl-(pentapeptide) pyrophosphoryl-undecaprenol N-acetylglucosamine transferase